MIPGIYEFEYVPRVYICMDISTRKRFCSWLMHVRHVIMFSYRVLGIPCVRLYTDLPISSTGLYYNQYKVPERTKKKKTFWYAFGIATHKPGIWQLDNSKRPHKRTSSWIDACTTLARAPDYATTPYAHHQRPLLVSELVLLVLLLYSSSRSSSDHRMHDIRTAAVVSTGTRMSPKFAQPVFYFQFFVVSLDFQVFRIKYAEYY